MSDTTIRKTIYVSADRETVWTYLTDAEKLGTWFHPAKADLAIGEDYTLISQNDGDRMCWGTVKEMRAPEYMQWDFTVGPMNGQMSQVEWTLADAPGGTQLTLVHSGLPENAEGFGLVLALDKGWHGFLGNMQQLEM